MKYREWMVLFVIVGLGIALANFVGFRVAFMESIPGIIVLLLIALAAVVLKSLLPFKFPVIAYASVVGLLAACPISPVADFVVQSTAKINFTAPLTIVGAFAGISISNQVKIFLKQGWKIVIVSLLVMTGTFVGSAAIANLVLNLTNAI